MRDLWGRMLKQSLIFVAAVIVLIAGIWTLIVLTNTPTGKDKAALALIRSEEKELARTFDLLVVRAGFQKKATGTRDIYVPSLLVWAKNASQRVSPAVILSVEFTNDGRSVCTAAALVPALESGGSTEIWLRCVDSIGFGAVVRGLSLAETVNGLGYRIGLESKRARITVQEGKLGSVFL